MWCGCGSKRRASSIASTRDRSAAADENLLADDEIVEVPHTEPFDVLPGESRPTRRLAVDRWQTAANAAGALRTCPPTQRLRFCRASRLPGDGNRARWRITSDFSARGDRFGPQPSVGPAPGGTIVNGREDDMIEPEGSPGPAELNALLRGDTGCAHCLDFAFSLAARRAASGGHRRGCGSYGVAMGWWRAPEQALYVAIKLPLIVCSPPWATRC